MKYKRAYKQGVAIAVSLLSTVLVAVGQGTPVGETPAGTIISSQAFADFFDVNDNPQTRVFFEYRGYAGDCCRRCRNLA